MPPERFQTYDAHGNPLGLAERDRVHREGLWHRAAHVWLFDHHGLLWLQRRANQKDIGPDLWDFTVGEHLQPGEDFAAAAARGLQEELGIAGVALEPFGPTRRAKHEDPQRGIRDWEETQAFRGLHDGPMHPDPAEVAALRRLSLAALEHAIARNPARFTPWFLDEARALGVITAPASPPSPSSAPTAR